MFCLNETYDDGEAKDFALNKDLAPPPSLGSNEDVGAGSVACSLLRAVSYSSSVIVIIILDLTTKLFQCLSLFFLQKFGLISFLTFKLLFMLKLGVLFFLLMLSTSTHAHHSSHEPLLLVLSRIFQYSDNFLVLPSICLSFLRFSLGSIF